MMLYFKKEKMIHKKNCNCCDCIWQRIIFNKGITIILKGRKKVSYRINGLDVEWVSMENSQNILFTQSREEICISINSREANLGPSGYPRTATSYKWALLNDPRIWLS